MNYFYALILKTNSNQIIKLIIKIFKMHCQLYLQILLVLNLKIMMNVNILN